MPFSLWSRDGVALPWKPNGFEDVTVTVPKHLNLRGMPRGCALSGRSPSHLCATVGFLPRVSHIRLARGARSSEEGPSAPRLGTAL